MPVDKFGLMPNDGDNTTIINPINRYALNLDELENVQGFNERGNANDIYAFKLNDKGVYERFSIKDININAGQPNIEFEEEKNFNNPFILKFRDGKWYAIPYKQNWDIDIRLVNDKISTKGDTHHLIKVYNSGGMMCNLLSNNPGEINVKHRGYDYFLTTNKPRGVMTFKTEFNDQRGILHNNLPDFCTIIIDGFINETSGLELELLEGVNVVWNNEKTLFRIAILKSQKENLIYTLPLDLDVKFDDSKLSLKNVFLHKQYDISRIRYSVTPVSKSDILYH